MKAKAGVTAILMAMTSPGIAMVARSSTVMVVRFDAGLLLHGLADAGHAPPIQTGILYPRSRKAQGPAQKTAHAYNHPGNGLESGPARYSRSSRRPRRRPCTPSSILQPQRRAINRAIKRQLHRRPKRRHQWRHLHHLRRGVGGGPGAVGVSGRYVMCSSCCWWWF